MYDLGIFLLHSLVLHMMSLIMLSFSAWCLNMAGAELQLQGVGGLHHTLDHLVHARLVL